MTKPTQVSNYRVLEYYNQFFAHNGYKLQVKYKFLWWEWWGTEQEDSLGINGYDWSIHYNCPIIRLEESK